MSTQKDGTAFALYDAMDEQPTETIFGLVTACDWDGLGNPIKIKICSVEEIDYLVAENEIGKSLFQHLRSWVEVRGRIFPIGSMRAIDIEEIGRLNTGGSR